MNTQQRALRFMCAHCCLFGVLDVPERPLARGMLIVTEQGQYRTGSHRHHTLISRSLSARGIPVLRFDHRGCGDSECSARRFDAIGDDIAAAVKEFFIHVPELKEIVIWGIGDAGTAAALYACTDARVCGQILLNPWSTDPEVAHGGRTEQARVGELEFWRNIASRSLDMAQAMSHIRQQMRRTAHDPAATLAQRLMASLDCFDGRTLVILGGADRQAQDFAALLARNDVDCQRIDIPAAGHSFASRAWRDQVAEASANWIVSW
ncbi:hydrolase 1, exosortase A system-associated [Massilia arenosa]|uniref:Hydrolase 1, exosortase A system-associated n=1 Tax=Zemynaea arenosa TaxID=2561931 RepID=A0A4Y9SGC1_9BURK|nr:hydrolase 1, exosortase A system-associated [Massilia arenosa]TFW23027.1 hydrolase 1, exosortase A system-associated [Massilia arenosa]